MPLLFVPKSGKVGVKGEEQPERRIYHCFAIGMTGSALNTIGTNTKKAQA